MPAPTEQELIAAFQRMTRASQAAETARDAYIQANNTAEAAKQAFHLMACAFCSGS